MSLPADTIDTVIDQTSFVVRRNATPVALATAGVDFATRTITVTLDGAEVFDSGASWTIEMPLATSDIKLSDGSHVTSFPEIPMWILPS